MAAPLIAALGLGALFALGGRSSGSSGSSSSPPPGGPPGGGGGPSSPPGGGGTSSGMPQPPPGWRNPASPCGGPVPPPRYPFPGRRWVEGLEESSALMPPERDAQVLEWLRRGLIDEPRWVWVTMPTLPGAERPRLEVQVPSDAVSLGGVRLCASMIAAQRIADAWGCLLPTAGIIHARWRAATVRVPPYTMGYQLPGGGWFNPGGGAFAWLYEQDGIESCLERVDAGGAARARPGAIIDTSGKDYVLGPNCLQFPRSTNIFGWYQLSGVPIQSPNTGNSGQAHLLDYYDYSHRIMVVGRMARLDGVLVPLADIYRDRSELVSYSGAREQIPVRHPGIPLAA